MNRSSEQNFAFTEHFSVGQLARMWAMGRETVRKLIKDEPDVMRVRIRPKKANVRYSIPAPVAERSRGATLRKH